MLCGKALPFRAGPMSFEALPPLRRLAQGRAFRLMWREVPVSRRLTAQHCGEAASDLAYSEVKAKVLQIRLKFC